MKMFIPLVCLLSITAAEPPVSEGYPAARSGQDQGFGRSLSQEYGTPSRGFGARSISQGYGPPAARSALSTEYGAPAVRSGISEEYGVPSSRGIDTEYGAPEARSLSQEYGAPSARLSEEYGTPVGSLSQQYGAPSLRGVSQQYGASALRNSLDYSDRPSSSYSAPGFRSTPSEEYREPQSFSRGFSASGIDSFRNAPSEEYGAPTSRNANGFNQKSNFNARQSSHSALKSSRQFSSSRSLSSQYAAPNARSKDSYSKPQSSRGLSQSYNAPNARGLSDTYGAPNARGISQEYGTPTARSSGKTDAYATSFGAAARSPSQKYGAPMPSESYGVPDQYNALSSQGYNYARNSLDELQNSVPANYDFAYKVNDYESGSDFGHTETREDNRAIGSYFVVLPDGTKQVVEYEADERGFKPRITVEAAEGSGAGYDDNAQNLGRSGDGPY